MATTVNSGRPPDIERLARELDAAEEEARAIVKGLSEARGAWRASPTSWSVSECLDHLATANRVYLHAMQPAAEAALAAGRVRRRPAEPGIVGRWFVRTLEPPVRPARRIKAPKKIVPRQAPPLADSVAAFLASQSDVRAFLAKFAGIDLAAVRFPNPFIRGLRFSLATGLHVITSHERRHLWQARRVLEASPAIDGSA